VREYNAGMRRENESSLPIWATAALALLLIVYPLLMGPAQWLCTDSMNRLDGVKGKAFLTAYFPLLFCYQRGPEPLRKAIGAYLSLWRK